MRTFLLASIFLLAGCTPPEVISACDDYCVQRAACDRDKGDTPSSTCRSSCLDFQADDVVRKNNACRGKTSCEYAVCYPAS
jgi:hypothetical protein